MPTGQKEVRKKKQNKTTRFSSVHVAKISLQTFCPWPFFSVFGLHPAEPLRIALPGTQGQVLLI